MIPRERTRIGAPRLLTLMPPAMAVILASAAAFLLIAAALFVSVARPATAVVSECTTGAEEVASDVRAAVEKSVGARPSGSSVDACEGGHYVEVGLDFLVESQEDIRAALTRDGCRPSPSPASDEFACRWKQDGYDMDILLIRGDGTSVVAYVDL